MPVKRALNPAPSSVLYLTIEKAGQGSREQTGKRGSPVILNAPRSIRAEKRLQDITSRWSLTARMDGWSTPNQRMFLEAIPKLLEGLLFWRIPPLTNSPSPSSLLASGLFVRDRCLCIGTKYDNGPIIRGILGQVLVGERSITPVVRWFDCGKIRCAAGIRAIL